MPKKGCRINQVVPDHETLTEAPADAGNVSDENKCRAGQKRQRRKTRPIHYRKADRRPHDGAALMGKAKPHDEDRRQQPVATRYRGDQQQRRKLGQILTGQKQAGRRRELRHPIDAAECLT